MQNGSNKLTKIKEEITRFNTTTDSIKTLEAKITRLSGEVSILRANMISLEKENFNLKNERSKAMLGELNKIDKIKKEIKILQTENRIKENQLRAFKRPKMDINVNWAAEVLNQTQICVQPFEYTRLEKMHDYFYDDFKKIADMGVVQEIKKLKNQTIFIDFFLLFCGHRGVFNEFIFDIFTQFEEFPRKKLFKILKYCPLDWITAFFERQRFVEALVDFLENDLLEKNTILFFIKIAENRPFLLDFILSKKNFNKIIKIPSIFKDELVLVMAKKKLIEFVDYQNLHYIKNKHLKVFFPKDYVEF